MARRARPVPSQLAGWPDPDELEQAPIDEPVRSAAVLVARWRAAVLAELAVEGVSHAAVAEATGVSERSVRRVLSGGSWPDLVTLVGVAAAAGVPLPGTGPGGARRARPRCTECVHALGRPETQRTSLLGAWHVARDVHGDEPDWWHQANCAWVEHLRGQLDGSGIDGRHPPPDWMADVYTLGDATGRPGAGL